MASFGTLAAAYVLGGLTFFPVLILTLTVVYLLFKPFLTWRATRLKQHTKTIPKSQDQDADVDSGQFYKVGWLRVSRDDQQTSTDASIGEMVKSYIAGKSGARRRNGNVYFAVLKYSTLFLYDSEKQLDCKGVIIVHNHTVATHPPGLQDFELFSRPHLIKLEKKTTSALLPASETNMPQSSTNAYYINCSRCIDKEDWYFALRRASKLSMPLEGETLAIKHWQDTTHFDQVAMNQLIATVHSDEHHFQTQWLNAILGRMFFAIYKTEEIKSLFLKKVVAKVNKLNARRPPFLGEITVRSVDPGHALPYITQPRLLGLSPTGELTAEANMQYHGGFRFEIETVLKWKYSDRLRPLTVDLVLAIALKEIQGKFLMKIKEPPTNRFWYGFYELPKMEWLVEPVVWEKRVGYSVVVKAIETKIQELVMENMVLPNMDDITFFPTNGVGGIFGESPDESGSEEDRIPAKQPSSPDKDDAIAKTPPKTIATTITSSTTATKSLPDLTTSSSSTSIRLSPPNQKPKRRRWFTKDEHRPAVPAASVSDSTVTINESELPKQNTFFGHILNRKPTTDASAVEIPKSIGTASCMLSSSPDSLSSSPSNSSIDDSPARGISTVLEDGGIMITPSSAPVSCELESCSQGTHASSVTLINDNDSLIVDKGHSLRKSSSIARLKAKTLASTAVSQISVAPAMAPSRSAQTASQMLEKKDEVATA
ncbi:hypothetical protein EC973_000604 [Apophysomyces ossiformis]|uniref:SMP-LTD domain-containing protein n=1 Tax=Apophysomyces ossiformis TaxID=679940 RepID=A0A8H7BY56_9FUNG|nr:hypothetical protein EC973_000604 [Apophysomyces ossiformis]